MKQLRERAGLRTVDIASKVGVAESTVRSWESGNSEPHVSAEGFKQLLDVYQVTIDELIDAIKESKPTPKRKSSRK